MFLHSYNFVTGLTLEGFLDLTLGLLGLYGPNSTLVWLQLAY